MQLLSKNNIQLAQFELLKPFAELAHGVVTRQSGSPHDPFDLNIQLSGTEKIVQHHFEHLVQSYALKHPIYAKQVHGDKIDIITPKNLDDSFECDGFVTDCKHVTLIMKHADCQAALFYDPTKNVIGNVHCGWRGNVLNIYSKMIATMQKKFGCQPKDILVCISPSLGPNHAEFIHYEKELPKAFWPFKDSNNHFNFWGIAQMQLQNAGILNEHMEVAKMCTFENKDLYFSYRRKDKTARNLTFISL